MDLGICVILVVFGFLRKMASKAASVHQYSTEPSELTIPSENLNYKWKANQVKACQSLLEVFSEPSLYSLHCEAYLKSLVIVTWACQV